MRNDKFIFGLYDNEKPLLKAIDYIRGEGVEITDAITPFPVHGIEEKLGLEDSRLHTAGFFYGLTGMGLALLLMTWVSTVSYPTVFGGKPYFALPSFVPITFELTVLFSAVGMVITYIIRNELSPFKSPRIFDTRLTDDRFALTFGVDDLSEMDQNKIAELLNKTGALDVRYKVFDDEKDDLFDTSSTPFVAYSLDNPSVEEQQPSTAHQEISETDALDVLKQNVKQVSENDADDLKEIKGIGKVYEKRLNDFGIYTFAQIADLNAESISAVEVLTGFPGRVEREEWIAQAKKLMG